MDRRTFLKAGVAGVACATLPIPDFEPKAEASGLNPEKLRLAKTVLESRTDVSWRSDILCWQAMTVFQYKGRDWYCIEYYDPTLSVETIEERHSKEATKAMKEVVRKGASWKAAGWPPNG